MTKTYPGADRMFLEMLVLAFVILLSLIVFLIVRYRDHDVFKQLVRRYLLNEKPVQPVVEVAPPPPPPPPPPLPPIGEGNVREVPEEMDVTPPETDDLHVFPDRLPPKTRFEEFNWRLFTYQLAESGGKWPDTLTDDFATQIRVKSEQELILHIRKRLRPRYPVILDRRGWWTNASRNLEMDPDYEDQFTAVYFALPPEQRPVVVSASQLSDTGALTLFRYGFEPFHLFESHLKPFTRDALSFVLASFVGERPEWKWFSIARMRHKVVKSNRTAALMNRVMERLDAEKKRIAHENRFTALWATVERPQQALEATPPSPSGDTGA